MIFTLVRILIFTLIWAALQGAFTLSNLVVGVLLSAIILGVTRPLFESDPERVPGRVRPLRRAWLFFVLVLVFLRELMLSATRVARLVLQPRLALHPGIIAYPLDVQTDREITALANLITLTPGTLSLDASDDKRTLYVHAIMAEGEEGRDTIQEIKETLEKHVARALGPARPDAAAPDEA